MEVDEEASQQGIVVAVAGALDLDRGATVTAVTVSESCLNPPARAHRIVAFFPHHRFHDPAPACYWGLLLWYLSLDR